LSIPLQKAAAAFQEAQPGVAISVLVDKPLAQLAKLESGQDSAAVAVTFGEVEMKSLVAAGVVRQDSALPFATNRYPLAVVVPATAAVKSQNLSALTSDEVNRIFIEDSARSTLGARAEGALKQLGLWDKVSGKVVRPKPETNLLAALLAGEADAAIIIKGCLFTEKGPGGTIPKTVRILAEFPAEVVSPIHNQAAPLASTKHSKLATDFVQFLVSERGREVLEGAGLTPP
jgi:molybdate transport system substrate-binding protein